MKRQRQTALLRLVREEALGSQEQIRARLSEAGFEATQSTISRDLEELGLVRIRDGDGRPRYAELADAGAGGNGNGGMPSLEGLLREFALAVEVSGNLVLVKTPPGAASAVAQGLDHSSMAGLLGTVAGDDTILVVARSSTAGKTLAAALRDMAGAPVKGPT